MNNQNISFVILSWERVKGTDYLVKWARAEPLIDEIIIWNNNTCAKVCSHLNDSYSHDCRIINSDTNLMCYGRWLGVQRAENDIVYVQDDDWKPGNLSILYHLYNKSERDVVAYCASTHKINTPESRFVGFGSIVNKSCAPTIINKYINKFGEDFLLHRECDLLITNINTYEKHVTKITAINDTTHDRNAMWRQPDHINYHNDMIERCKVLINE